MKSLLLLYLAWVTALLGLFASIIYGLMQPTVIPNAGLAGYKAPGLTNLFLHKPDSAAEDMERAAIDAAETENRDQGIEPLLAFAAVESALAKNPEGRRPTPRLGLLQSRRIRNRSVLPIGPPPPISGVPRGTRLGTHGNESGVGTAEPKEPAAVPYGHVDARIRSTFPSRRATRCTGHAEPQRSAER